MNLSTIFQVLSNVLIRSLCEIGIGLPCLDDQLLSSIGFMKDLDMLNAKKLKVKGITLSNPKKIEILETTIKLQHEGRLKLPRLGAKELKQQLQQQEREQQLQQQEREQQLQQQEREQQLQQQEREQQLQQQEREQQLQQQEREQQLQQQEREQQLQQQEREQQLQQQEREQQLQQQEREQQLQQQEREQQLQQQEREQQLQQQEREQQLQQQEREQQLQQQERDLTQSGMVRLVHPNNAYDDLFWAFCIRCFGAKQMIDVPPLCSVYSHELRNTESEREYENRNWLARGRETNSSIRRVIDKQ